MRIIQFCTTFKPGGIQRHSLDLAEWLREQGHDVLLAGSPGPWAGPKDDRRFIDLPTFRASSAGGPFSTRIRALLRSTRLLRSALAESPVDLIHTHDTAPAIVSRLATIGTRTRIVMSCHGYPEGDAGRVARVSRLATHHVISPSRLLGEELCRYGLTEERVTSIGYGIRPLREVDAEEVARTRSRLLGDDGRVLAVVVARLAHQKGLDVLVRVVARARLQVAGLRVVLVGGGPLGSELREWIREAGIAEVLSLEGMRSDVERYLLAGDFFLLTSRWEALPLSIVEAFRAGLPVIATDCGGVRELVDDTVGAVLPVGDVPAISDAIVRIANRDDLRGEMRRRAIERSRLERFQPEYVHRSIEAVFREVTGGAGPLPSVGRSVPEARA